LQIVVSLPNSKLPTFLCHALVARNRHSLKPDYPLDRHSRAGGNPARKITREADKACMLTCFAGVFQSTMDSRLRGNDGFSV
jgi:hypothetical protein